MRIDRINQMRAYISQRESVSLDELAAVSRVSKNTVRRDVDEIVAEGLYKKSYGGISAVKSDTVFSVSWDTRLQHAAEAKRRIAAEAACLIEDHSCIYMDSGTTTYALADYLPQKRQMTVVTNSLPLIAKTIGLQNHHIFVLGGMYSESSCSLQGDSAIDVFSHLNVDAAFISTSGIAIATGLSNSTISDAAFKRRLIARVPKVILLADATKFNKQALFSFCDLSALHAVVTDQKPPEEFCTFFAAHGVRLIVCSQGDTAKRHAVSCAS